MRIRNRIDAFRDTSVFRFVRSIGSVITIAVLLAVGYLGGHWLSPAHQAEETVTEDSATALATEVKLPAAKVTAARLSVVPVSMRKIQQTATVPGSVEYDAQRHVELKMPLDGVVDEIFVQPGQQVEPGQPLAKLSSDALAVARNDALRSEAEIRLAQTRYAWNQEIHENLIELLRALEEGKTPDEIEADFAKRALGESRQQLLSCYSDLRRATEVLQESRALEQQGVISGRVFQQRVAEWEQSGAKFRALCEQIQFDAKQSLAVAEAELQVVKRKRDAELETLRVLLGPYAEASTDQRPAEFQLYAPTSGRIVELRAVPSLRAAKGELLAVVADMSRLWLSARVHQRHWAATNLKTGEAVAFRVPAFRDQTWNAAVRFVGTQVIPGSHALPLVAEIDNGKGLLRPGMFAWVTVPLAPPVKTLAIPRSAVQRHEGKTFVFAKTGDNVYRRVDVTLGLKGDEWVAVTSGLSAGDRVVSEGAFFLKSELLLEREAE